MYLLNIAVIPATNYTFFLWKIEIGQFQKIVGGLIELVDELAKEAETEKMKVSMKQMSTIFIRGSCCVNLTTHNHLKQAIGARNLLKSVAKQREAQQQQLQALIAEKKMQLERYILLIIIHAWFLHCLQQRLKYY